MKMLGASQFLLEIVKMENPFRDEAPNLVGAELKLPT
jgi:hypothetical protein